MPQKRKTPQRKSKAAADLARQRWKKVPKSERSRFAREVARARWGSKPNVKQPTQLATTPEPPAK